MRAANGRPPYHRRQHVYGPVVYVYVVCNTLLIIYTCCLVIDTKARPLRDVYLLSDDTSPQRKPCCPYVPVTGGRTFYSLWRGASSATPRERRRQSAGRCRSVTSERQSSSSIAVHHACMHYQYCERVCFLLVATRGRTRTVSGELRGLLCFFSGGGRGRGVVDMDGASSLET